MRKSLAVGVVASTLLSVAANAQEQPPQPVCMPLEQFIHELDERYQESVSYAGLLVGGALMVILKSEKGSFSVLVVKPDKNRTACLMGAGEGFETAKHPANGPEA